jgi:hypothetical protein
MTEIGGAMNNYPQPNIDEKKEEPSREEIQTVTGEKKEKLSKEDIQKRRSEIELKKSMLRKRESSEISIKKPNTTQIVEQLAEENAQLKRQLEQQKELVPLESNNNGVAEQTRKLHQANLALYRELLLLKAVNTFSDFVYAYLDENMKNSKSYGLFSSHGGTGQQNAKDFHDLFNRHKNKLKLNHENANLDIQHFLRELIDRCDLTGNYNPNSFKTYMVAYHQYIGSLNDTRLCDDKGIAINIADYMDQLCKTYASNGIEELYMEYFFGNANKNTL